MEQKTQEAAGARRMRIAMAIIGLYRRDEIRANEFDETFKYLEESGHYLSHGYDSLKRSHIAAARGVSSARRMLNRAKSEISAGYSSVSYATNAIRSLTNRLAQVAQRQEPPKISDLIADLEALERDFPTVKFEGNYLTVHTDPITLTYDGMSVDFNDFSIRLDMKAVATKSEKPYEVQALDPVWTPNEEYCHPHLTGRDLCDGDGRSAAWKAASEGRIYDFFIIINQILNTYNPNSPYAKLEVWVHGDDDENHFLCENCEESFHIDDRYVCEHCGESFCENCSVYCDHVDLSYCHTCVNNGYCAEDCEYVGLPDCHEHENPACFICGEVPADGNRHECEHAYRASTYGRAGRSTDVSLCRDCLDDAVEARRPCTLSHMVTQDDGRRVTRETCCPHFGEEDCAFVESGELEEGASAAAEDDEAQSEQEVANASTE